MPLKMACALRTWASDAPRHGVSVMKCAQSHARQYARARLCRGARDWVECRTRQGKGAGSAGASRGAHDIAQRARWRTLASRSREARDTAHGKIWLRASGTRDGVPRLPSALVMASFFSTPPPLRCVELVELYKKDMGHIELRSRPPTLPAVRKSLFSYLFALSQLFGTERRGSGAAGRLYVAPPPYTRTRGCAPGGSPIGWAVLLLTSTSRARTRHAPRTASGSCGAGWSRGK